MDRLAELKEIYTQSGLSDILRIKKEADYPHGNYSALRFVSNEYRLRAIEIWDRSNDRYFRIYHSPNIATEIKEKIDEIDGMFRSKSTYTDLQGDFQTMATALASIISNDAIVDIARKTYVLAKDSAYEGLSLPDVDPSDDDIFGREFTWKEVLAISDDSSEDNPLKTKLSQSGVYLQRSSDGKSRYIGAAYNSNGILARWLKHLKSNGDAKHLNLYVLENGYNNLVFTVLEITAPEDALKAEKKWKSTLATKNSGPYDSIRLNNN